jgi:5'-3' exonuclease
VDMKIGLVDGNPLIWRCVGMFDNLRTKDGVHTGYLFGALQNLIRGLKLSKVDTFVVCWDVGKSRWRRELYPIQEYTEKDPKTGEEVTKKRGYKCSRESGGDPLPVDIGEILKEFELMQKMLAQAGVVQLGVQGVEADDLVGMMASAFSQLDKDVVIIAQDQDYHLLLNKNVVQLDPVQKKWYDEDTARTKWNGWEGDLTDLFALSGAGGDDIPHIKGLGPAGARKMLEEYKTLDNLLDPIHAPDLRKKGKLWEAVVDNREMVRLAHALTTIPTCDKHHQLNDEERLSFRSQIWAERGSNRMDFVGLAERYELTRVINELDVLFRPKPSFAGFEKWFPSIV